MCGRELLLLTVNYINKYNQYAFILIEDLINQLLLRADAMNLEVISSRGEDPFPGQ